MRKLCEEKRATADGTSSIYFQYFPDSTHRVFLNTGITIPPKFWDCHKQRIKDSLPTTYGDHQKLNDEIIRQYRLAEDLVKLVKSSGIENPGEFVKEKFSPGLRLDTMIQCDWKLRTQMEKAETSFFLQQMEDDIHAKSRKVKPGTLTVFQSMRLHFQAFEKHRGKAIQFESLDFQFYEDLIDFLTHHYTLPRKKDKAVGLRVNTIGKTIHQFRIFIKDRVKRRIIPAIDLSDYKVPTEETDAVYLAPDEIGQIYTLDLTERPELTPARNLFVLECLTGLRFSDFSNLKPEDLQQDMLHKKQEKSVHWVVIPLRKEAKAIFTEEFKNDIPRICNSEFNQKIKEIGKLAGIERPIKFSYRKANRMIDVKKPKYSWITSHTARRSFCTNEFLAGTPVYLIMKISGHKREKDFYRYIRVDPQEAALKVKELWMQRGDIEVFKNPLKKAINLTAFQASDTDCIEKGQAVNLQNQ
jgi:hypothetical protein